jgi:hypothetical protein
MKGAGLFFPMFFLLFKDFRSCIFIKQLHFHCKHLADEIRGQYANSYKIVRLLRRVMKIRMA